MTNNPTSAGAPADEVITNNTFHNSPHKNLRISTVQIALHNIRQ